MWNGGPFFWKRGFLPSSSLCFCLLSLSSERKEPEEEEEEVGEKAKGERGWKENVQC